MYSLCSVDKLIELPSSSSECLIDCPKIKKDPATPIELPKYLNVFLIEFTTALSEIKECACNACKVGWKVHDSPTDINTMIPQTCPTGVVSFKRARNRIDPSSQQV
ncbi:hypothetical protein WICPIJ_008328 [Wickerhamomyces pijperi]|uniref:Uncharacterized protein n=1 Tax=Wickerhamomyces pijperi TaxID=599730 RepID=A0A9P8TIQ8_WICPI|nr:hypothetical protein WICPIJ_008328 [Wickerhamomyces pijperi]